MNIHKLFERVSTISLPTLVFMVLEPSTSPSILKNQAKLFLQ